MWEPQRLSWVDLSFNKLTSVPDVLCKFENISVLYLHGNSIEKVGQVAKLQPLNAIRSLTLHGNNLENAKNYRNYVIGLFPLLRSLDFSGLTALDYEKSKRFHSARERKLQST